MKKNYAGYIVRDNSNTVFGDTNYTGDYTAEGKPEERYFFSKKCWAEGYYVEYFTTTKTFGACIEGVTAPECVEEKTLMAAVAIVDDWNGNVQDDK